MPPRPRLERLAPSAVILDPRNPRLSKAFAHYPLGEEITLDRMKLALLADVGNEESASSGTTVVKLRASIWTHGTIISPIICNRVDGRDVCVEGNTRALIMAEFGRQFPADERWQTIPALVYDDMSQEHVNEVRLLAHLVGARSWTPYARGMFLHDLRYNSDTPWDDIVACAGGRQAEAETFIAAYEDMEAHYRPLTLDGGFVEKRFSGFLELQNKEVVRALTETGYTKADFGRWVHERRFQALWHIRALPSILREPRARAAFLAKNSKEALKLVDRPDAAKSLDDLNLIQIARALSDAIGRVSVTDLSGMRESGAVGELEDAQQRLKVLVGVIRTAASFDDDGDGGCDE